jgi:hypothetical protein
MNPHYLVAVLKVALVFIVLPLAAIALVFLLLKKIFNKNAAVIGSGLLLILLAYVVITDIFPTPAFVQRNFEENTNVTIPASAKLVSTFGNQSIWGFGDYNFSYAYQLSSEDCRTLDEQLREEGFVQSRSWLETEKVNQLLESHSTRTVVKTLKKDFKFKQFDVLFLDDNKTVIFNSNKW